MLERFLCNMENLPFSPLFCLFGHEYEFKNKMVVKDGLLLSSRISVYNAIMELLTSSGFRFSPLNPVPAVIVNYMSVKFDLIVRLLRSIIVQLNAGLNVSETAQTFYILTSDGFCIKSPEDNKIYRVCVVEFFTKHSNLVVSKHFCLVNQLTHFVDFALSRGLNILIS